MMSFYDWMMKKYLGKNTQRSDFAEDMKCSGDFTKCNDKEAILAYLHRNNACAECVVVFKKCWKDYEKCERVQ